MLDRSGQSPNPCPNWLTETAWDNITELDKIPGFHGCATTFEQSPRDWQNWSVLFYNVNNFFFFFSSVSTHFSRIVIFVYRYVSTEPESIPLIGEWETNLNHFQKMLFIRSLRPDRLAFCASQFVISNLGQRYVEPPVLDVKAVFEDSTPVGNFQILVIIFILFFLNFESF